MEAADRAAGEDADGGPLPAAEVALGGTYVTAVSDAGTIVSGLVYLVLAKPMNWLAAGVK